jgi:hypothetical protein
MNSKRLRGFCLAGSKKSRRCLSGTRHGRLRRMICDLSGRRFGSLLLRGCSLRSPANTRSAAAPPQGRPARPPSLGFPQGAGRNPAVGLPSLWWRCATSNGAASRCVGVRPKCASRAVTDLRAGSATRALFAGSLSALDRVVLLDPHLSFTLSARFAQTPRLRPRSIGLYLCAPAPPEPRRRSLTDRPDLL